MDFPAGNEALLRTLEGDVVAGAKALLGSTLIKGTMHARVVEVEAYRGADDPASHAFRGRTSRNGVMYGPSGIAYVYFNYGVHWMLNVTALESGLPAAVLIRAALPLAGLDDMRTRRPGVSDEQLLSGPGKLTQAFGISAEEQGLDLLRSAEGFRIEAAEPAVRILSGPRVGIAQGKGHETPWRFVDADALRWISKPSVST